MKILQTSCLCFFAVFLQLAGAQSNQNIVLWPHGAPGPAGKEPKDIPTLSCYRPKPEIATSAAMLICPGGGYTFLHPRSGQEFAVWFAEHGVTAFVLNYRLGGKKGYRHPAQFDDATRAIRLLRARAGEWDIDPKRIVIIGASAGGHLASMVLTHSDAGKPEAADRIERQSSRPDLGILCFAVITLVSDPSEGAVGSGKNILGDQASLELKKSLSGELQVTPQTPPCFIWHTWEATVVSMENSLMFAEALRQAGVPFDLHVYQTGPHGLGIDENSSDPASPLHPWARDCLYWLKEKGFVR
jgi:acetyl esterase/lipase